MVARKTWRLSVATKMACNLVLLSVFSLATAHFVGLIPNTNRHEIERKVALVESLAITSSLLAQNGEDLILEENLKAVVARFPIASAASLRNHDGNLICKAGDQLSHLGSQNGMGSANDQIEVPIFDGERHWGTIDVQFQANSGFHWLAEWHIIPLLLFTAVLNVLVFRWYMSRALVYLDPTRSVPMHVRSTLDIFSEGVVVMDADQRIVLANDKFKSHLEKTDQEILGKSFDELPWRIDDGDESPGSILSSSEMTHASRTLRVWVGDRRHIFQVNASAILANDGQHKGMIASFDDITPIEESRRELSTALSELQISRDQLTVRNEELQFLATRDPLTGCINRRTFFELFDQHWRTSSSDGLPLSCFMVDVDHFKSVNDNHGHSTGDDVLRKVAATIQKESRDSDIVCRYGGEEFCVLLPNTDINQAEEVAERMRIAISLIPLDILSVTASLGVSSVSCGPEDPQALLDQADQCLYVAKRNGRNQVVRWDQVPPESDEEVALPAGNTEPVTQVPVTPNSIPYPAVTSLLSALAFRDSDTAAHSVRVAELCAAMAFGMLSVQDTYVLEIAALLHDIGKIGVPDEILRKPGMLTPKEWELMKLHDRIGVEIVETSFSNRQLIDYVRYHHGHFGGCPDNPDFPVGLDLPIGARIIAIVDAYDAMVSDRVYRKGRSPHEAFRELRRCAGTQFDPELVERFIDMCQRFTSKRQLNTTKQVALQVGSQIERLAKAVDDLNILEIKALAAQLESTATGGGIQEIENLTAAIRATDEGDEELAELMDLVKQLMSMCRSIQKIHIDPGVNFAPSTHGNSSWRGEPIICSQVLKWPANEFLLEPFEFS